MTISAAWAAGPVYAADGGADDASARTTATARFFPRPAAIEPQVRFWRSIFATYSIHQVVLHDALRLDKVYKVLDFRHYLEDGMGEGEVARLERIETDLELEKLRATLLRLHGLGAEVDRDTLSAEERHVLELWKDDAAPDRFLAAAGDKRLRSQRGLKERFAEGVRVSRRYLPEMERIFRDEGLPTELTRLPLIESCFNVHAYSKVGAAGIWQFMPSTGRHYMRVDNLVDERRDPIHATHAAAQFLRQMHDALDTWPLAITAYNHGQDGIARAIRETDSSDIATIIRDYRGASFGFASRNFYAEFLAAVEVERDYKTHFGELALPPPWSARAHRLEHAVGIEAAARLARTERDELAGLNPALADLVVSGRRPIPRGYTLWVPAGGSSGFGERVTELAAEAAVTRVAAPAPHKAGTRRGALRPAVATYRVQRGQTLSHIAKKHKVSVASLRTANRIGKAGRLRTGQVLRIPSAARAAM